MKMVIKPILLISIVIAIVAFVYVQFTSFINGGVLNDFSKINSVSPDGKINIISQSSSKNKLFRGGCGTTVLLEMEKQEYQVLSLAFPTNVEIYWENNQTVDIRIPWKNSAYYTKSGLSSLVRMYKPEQKNISIKLNGQFFDEKQYEESTCVDLNVEKFGLH